jgi:hypothetical protein
MPPKRTSGIDAEIDALFRLPLGEFTGARNALAARLKKEGRALEAERVKALAKPPAPAWAVNQLYWQSPKEIGQLLAAGERVRKAQLGQLRNADLRGLLEQKKQILAALVSRASAILGEAGLGASPDAMRRVAATLESLAVWGGADGAPKAGRLTADLDPPGFEILAAVLDGEKLEPAKVLQFRTAKPAEDPAAARARAREAVQAAEKALREARRDAERAEAAAAKANERAAAAEARYAEARDEARAASSEARKLAQAVMDAERSLSKARAALADQRTPS